MRVPRGHDRDTGIEIQKPVAIDVLHKGAFAAAHHKRIAAGIRGGQYRMIPGNDRLRVGPGKWSNKVWQVRTDHGQTMSHTANLLVLNERNPNAGARRDRSG